MLLPLSARWQRWECPERLQFLVAVVPQIAIAGLLVGALAEGQWLVAFTVGVVLALTSLPAPIEPEVGVQLPLELTAPGDGVPGFPGGCAYTPPAQCRGKRILNRIG